jgi:chemotaxis family two-component system response regulator PixH
MNKVLIVEDSLTDLTVLMNYLCQLGYSVACVSNGEEVPSSLSSFQPDIIFLDVILPGKSGFEVCRDLKMNSTTKKIPIVFCSSKNTDVDRTWGNMLGAEAYLSKPVQPEELLSTLNRLTAQHLNLIQEI